MSKPPLTVLWRNKIIFFKGTVKQLKQEIDNLKIQKNGNK